MDVDCIDFRETKYFSDLICDYLDGKKELIPFFNRMPELDNFKAQLEEKSESFPKANRIILSAALKKQYKNVETSEKTVSNIDLLVQQNTFTITTGHQLNLFTGPLYFLYKIISTINLTEQLKKKHPKNHFVPVYWMATEDHDFEEINYFNFDGKKVKWNIKTSGGVGRLSTEGLSSVFEVITKAFGETENANYLKKLFQRGIFRACYAY